MERKEGEGKRRKEMKTRKRVRQRCYLKSRQFWIVCTVKKVFREVEETNLNS